MRNEEAIENSGVVAQNSFFYLTESTTEGYKEYASSENALYEH